ncbi:MAG: hypothetical protein FWH55_04885 [Oscillospiraceae bacterium]|nr:hypothetical protein [Oscillospiraceae bacterium]
MDLSWVSLLFLTFFWFSIVTVYQPGPEFTPLCIIAALLFAFASCFHESRRSNTLMPKAGKTLSGKNTGRSKGGAIKSYGESIKPEGDHVRSNEGSSQPVSGSVQLSDGSVAVGGGPVRSSDGSGLLKRLFGRLKRNALKAKERWFRLGLCAADGVSLCALVLAAQGAVFPFLYWLFARYHAESFFAKLSGMLLRLIGLKAVADQDVIFIESALKTVTIASAWEKTGVFFFLLILAGGFVLLALKKARWWKYLLLVIVTFFYTVIRYAFVLAVYANYELHGIFWERVTLFIFLVPYVLILSILFGKSPDSPIYPAKLLYISFRPDKDSSLELADAMQITIVSDKNNSVKPADAMQITTVPDKSRSEKAPVSAFSAVRVIAIAAAIALVFSGTAFFGWRDKGAEKKGRIVIDEYHSDWEWTDIAYDETWFGERSGYNYYCFYEHIDRYYEVSRNTEPIGPGTLSGVDILILKTPTSRYSDPEVATIINFVEGGGGLYLIGDHTNVFGSGAYLNQIATQVGLRYRYDCTYELTQGNLQEYKAPAFLPHPIVNQMPLFLFATSCTLEANWLADEVVLGYGLRNLPLDYSQKNFFPADEHSPLMEFGVFVQCAGMPYGRGRILAFTDSTVFSNFWMFMPGKPELLIKSLQWLNRENDMSFPPRLAAAVGLAVAAFALICTIWISRQRGHVFPIGPCLFAAVATFSVATLVFGAQSGAISMPEARKPITRICFESEYTTGYLPNDLTGFLTDMDKQISTFYVWTQRQGYMPSMEKNPEDALKLGDIAVIIKPGKTIEDPQALIKQVEEGKTLLILDNTGLGDNAGELLAHAGMRIQITSMANEATTTDLFGIAPFTVPLTDRAASIEGGHSLIADADGRSIFSVQLLGEGKIAVFSDPDLFYNINLGDISANLTDRSQILTQLEFLMFNYLLDKL